MKFERMCSLSLCGVGLVIILIGFSYGDGGEIEDKLNRRLPPCQACQVLVSSFNLGMDRTSKGSFGGGDTAWEEENKKVYKNSEVRLVEIQEGLCNEVAHGKDQCHELGGENEALLDEWWGTNLNTGPPLNNWLCVEKLKVCCPESHYGPDCLPCPGHPKAICSNHGKCKGSGTRKGSGECSCEVGYTSPLCDTCAKEYFEAYKEEGKLICSPCHKACSKGCHGPGSKNCDECKNGWEKDEERGCIDVNECLLEAMPCKHNEFCVNMEGAHTCIPCDKSCNGCFGDGPDMCEHCETGYVLKDKLCIDDSAAGRNMQMNTTRYFTYFGLCFATFIIFQKNANVAGVIGITVGIYIAASEYLLSYVNTL